jgi:FKBP-type peptidyl-prolyl cis-trans isomerase
MLQKIRLMIVCCLLSLLAVAQKTVSISGSQPPVSTQPSYNYIKLNPQLSYAFIINKPGTVHPQEGDQISVNMQSVHNNRVLFNTYTVFKGKPGVYSVNKPSFKGDFIEAVMLMTPGDSIVCMVDADALYKNTNNKKPDFIKSGDKMQYFVKLLSIKTKEQLQQEQQAAIMKQIKEQEAKQLQADDKKLKTWFAGQHISPVKTKSGLYYTIKQEGSGERAMPGDTVIMFYTGRLLDGTKFDSNEDSAFFHVAPYQFILGRGAVIKGLDEGIALLKSGSKASFYIPSPLGYGAQVSPPVNANPKGIPANSVLIFDMQLMSIKHPVAVATLPNKTDSLTTPVKN